MYNGSSACRECNLKIKIFSIVILLSFDAEEFLFSEVKTYG